MSKKRSRNPAIAECDARLAEIRRLAQLTHDYIRVLIDAGSPKSRLVPFERAYVSYVQQEVALTQAREIMIGRSIAESMITGHTGDDIICDHK